MILEEDRRPASLRSSFFVRKFQLHAQLCRCQMSSKSISVDPTLALDTAGQAPLLVAEIFNIIRDINQDGTTLLLVEQNARKALSIASRAYVLETGKIIREGRGVEL